jgi:hypothetical protein
VGKLAVVAFTTHRKLACTGGRRRSSNRCSGRSRRASRVSKLAVGAGTRCRELARGRARGERVVGRGRRIACGGDGLELGVHDSRQSKRKIINRFVYSIYI